MLVAVCVQALRGCECKTVDVSPTHEHKLALLVTARHDVYIQLDLEPLLCEKPGSSDRGPGTVRVHQHCGWTDQVASEIAPSRSVGRNSFEGDLT